MSIPRIYCKALERGNRTAIVEGKQANHITRVLRLKLGDPVELFNGQNVQCTSHITRVGKQRVELAVDDCQTVSRESPLQVTLIQGISRSERMDWVLQKATELGVYRIIPTLMMRSVVKLDNNKIESRLKHWQGILTHACEQCERNQLPLLESPASGLDVALKLDQSNLRFSLDPGSGHRLRDIQDMPTNISLIAGPEGGFDQKERSLMKQSGIQGLELGPRILRTETAGIAALSAIGAMWGDL